MSPANGMLSFTNVLATPFHYLLLDKKDILALFLMSNNNNNNKIVINKYVWIRGHYILSMHLLYQFNKKTKHEYIVNRYTSMVLIEL